MKWHDHKENALTDICGQRLQRAFSRWSVSGCWSKVFPLAIWLSFFCSPGCDSAKIKPVDIYPEDMCAQCRMAVSDQAFASEIITMDGEVFKFDDLGCLEKFKEKSPEPQIAAIFVKNYETKKWLPYERSTIVQTSIRTPMGSGKVAFADSAQAKVYLQKFPVME